jgi:hypothetical protein
MVIFNMNNNNLNIEMKTLIKTPKISLYAIIYRFLFILLIPIWVLFIMYATIMLLPYWIITGNIYYENKYIQKLNDWHGNLSGF